MALYVGLPVCYEEAFRIFGINIEDSNEIIMQKFNVKDKNKIYYYHYIEYLKRFLEDKNSEIKIYSTDKGQFIIGYNMEDNLDVWYKFVNVDETIINLLQLKSKFMKEMSELNADLSTVALEYMEGDRDKPKVVNNPMPYVICWGNY
jgi:hypothetical protein